MKRIVALCITIIGILLFTGCSMLSIFTYPEAQKMSGGTLRTHWVRVKEAGPEPVWELQNEIEFSKDDLRIVVTAKSCRNFPITLGPLVFPIIPIFWTNWIFDTGENLVLAVDFERAKGYEFDPSQFVVVQDGKELKPTILSVTHKYQCYNLERESISRSSKALILEYETKSWDFDLKLREIRNQSGTVVIPDIHFSRRSGWVYGLGP